MVCIVPFIEQSIWGAWPRSLRFVFRSGCQLASPSSTFPSAAYFSWTSSAAWHWPGRCVLSVTFPELLDNSQLLPSNRMQLVEKELSKLPLPWNISTDRSFRHCCHRTNKDCGALSTQSLRSLCSGKWNTLEWSHKYNNAVLYAWYMTGNNSSKSLNLVKIKWEWVELRQAGLCSYKVIN